MLKTRRELAFEIDILKATEELTELATDLEFLIKMSPKMGRSNEREIKWLKRINRTLAILDYQPDASSQYTYRD